MRATDPAARTRAVRGTPRWLLALGAILTAAGQAAAQTGDAPGPADPLRFAVLGHIRGDADGPSYLLDELLSEVRALDPDLVFLTGDMIWGDYHGDPVDTSLVAAEWRHLDSALASLDVPVHRVPGNHEIADVVARDLYESRYGLPPRAFDVGGVRFVLLASAWIPEDGDAGRHRFIRGVPIDSAQVGFLRDALDPSDDYEHAFVLMHHLLWWDEDAPWWRDVHPLLVRGRVRAVFSGEYGPMKFSHMERDGVRYVQSSVEGRVGLPILRALESSRLLSQQFDNFVLVTLDDPDGAEVDIEIETVGEVSSGHFTPQRWREIHESEDAGLLAALVRFWADVRSPRRLVLLGGALLAALGLGVLLGRGPLGRGRA